MAQISFLKKGNIMYFSIVTVLLFSLSLSCFLLISLTTSKRVEKIIKKSDLDRYEENLAYECYVKNASCDYRYTIDGYYITMYFNEGIKKYFIDGLDGCIIIRKVDINE